MREQDKPFVMYRRGPWNFTIVPHGIRGWRQFGIWMALLAPPTIAFVIFAEAHEGDLKFFIALALYLIATMIWTLGGIWWMRTRAEVIDVEQVLKLKRAQERKRR